MEVDGITKIFGVLGHPIKHTLSPLIHNFLFQKYKINSLYLAFDIKPDGLNYFIKFLKSLNNFGGINITVPFKRKIIKYLHNTSKEAKYILAVNTIKKIKGNLIGFNTDMFGFLFSLKKNFPNFNIKTKRILILGAGGASHSIIYGLLSKSVKKIFIANRTFKKAVNLKNYFNKIFNFNNIEVIPLEFNLLNKLNDIDLIINTTSVGLKNSDKLLINLKYLKNKDVIVYDLIYNPAMTKLLLKAKEYNLKTINGLDMLILQALKSFQIWTGKNVLSEFNILKEKALNFLK